ncbi:MAG: hypothetical protein HY390_06610 [Deltaproteobacteria bacterium]|nr:hypothetical protein [Deltaproteobacteria bacterium]
MSQKALFKKVIELSGLPPELIEQELKTVLKTLGISPEHMTEDDLRQAIAHYLREVIQKYKAP